MAHRAKEPQNGIVNYYGSNETCGPARMQNAQTSYEVNAAWKMRKLESALPWTDHTTDVDGVVVTKNGQMFLWEVYLKNHVFLQDKEGRILRIRGHEETGDSDLRRCTSKKRITGP